MPDDLSNDLLAHVKQRRAALTKEVAELGLNGWTNYEKIVRINGQLDELGITLNFMLTNLENSK